jgi:type VI secretion system protein ImpH
VNSPDNPYAQLLTQPRRFRFDAAVRILLRQARATEAADSIRFATPAALAYPASEIAAIEPPLDGRPAGLVTPVIGLAGPTGVLPLLYTDLLIQTLRNRSPALANFLRMLAQRLVGMFAGAGIKYRLNRSVETAAGAGIAGPDRLSEALLAFTGYATPHLTSRLAVGTAPLLYYSGLFSSHPRSAERLRALVSDWLGREVEVVQFAGSWLPLAPEQRTSLAHGLATGAWNSLGVDAAAGVRAWDPQARVILRIGPLTHSAFTALLPDRRGLQHLVSLVRAFLGFETGFAVNPVLAGPEVPPLSLDTRADVGPRLGWNTWIPAPGPSPLGIRRPDAVEAVFEAEIVEAEEARGRVQA